MREINNGVTTDNTGEALEDQLGLNNDSTEIPAHITKRQTLPLDHNIRSLLASTHNRRLANHTQMPLHRKSTSGDKQKEQIVLNGKRYIQTDTHCIQYCTASHNTKESKIALLVDRGANAGLAGEDVRLIEKAMRYADVWYQRSYH